jgi:hypothetical protein
MTINMLYRRHPGNTNLTAQTALAMFDWQPSHTTPAYVYAHGSQASQALWNRDAYTGAWMALELSAGWI